MKLGCGVASQTPKPKSEIGGYVATVVVLLLIVALAVAGAWLRPPWRARQPDSSPLGFGPGWTCAGGASLKGAGFCTRAPLTAQQPARAPPSTPSHTPP